MPYKEEKAHPGPLLVQVELAAGALVVQLMYTPPGDSGVSKLNAHSSLCTWSRGPGTRGGLARIAARTTSSVLSSTMLAGAWRACALRHVAVSHY